MTLLGLRVGFRLGSWLAPAGTLQRAYRLFCTPLPGSRQRAAKARPVDNRRRAGYDAHTKGE